MNVIIHPASLKTETPLQSDELSDARALVAPAPSKPGWRYPLYGIVGVVAFGVAIYGGWQYWTVMAVRGID